MRYYPIFLDTADARIVVSGAGETATAKLRLLFKASARIEVFGAEPTGAISQWAEDGRLVHRSRAITAVDLIEADLLYVTEADGAADLAALARQHGVLVNVVDTPELCDFITPALVDRDPVVVAIGTEGTAPMLARQIKAKVEALLSPATGELAQLAAKWRSRVEELAPGAPRRALWARFFGGEGHRAFEQGGADAAGQVIESLIEEAGSTKPAGNVALVGAGPGDPELLTRKAERLLGDADVVIHDRLVSAEILERARREARIVEVGKSAYGKSWKQADIDALIVAEAQAGHKVVRLKSGDPGIYGRLDEEVAALRLAGVPYEVVPGITAAVAGAAELGLSLTRRGRNSSLRILTGHDVDGFAEHDWTALAAPGATAAIYMGVRAARFIQGRLLMHGASAATPVTVVENVSRANRVEIAATLADLPEAMAAAGITGPAILYFGIAPLADVAEEPSTKGSVRHAEAR